MVSPRFIDFLLVLICLLLTFSTGHSLQVKKSTISIGIKLRTETSSVNVEELMHQRAPEMDQSTRFRRSGRKMESRTLSKAMESQNQIAEASSTADGEVHCIENCDNGGKGMLNVMREFSKRSRHNSVGVKMSGFVSWNADYPVPRPHPPKNN